MGLPAGWTRQRVPAAGPVLLCLAALAAAPERLADTPGGTSVAAAAEDHSDMVLVRAGSYAPLFRDPGQASRIPVDAFLMDRYLVSNADFAAFVAGHPGWAPARVKPVFADPNYLNQWQGSDPSDPTGIGPQPVTEVSWFAARAYCRAQGKRLPGVDEWEYAAGANEHSPEARDDPEFRQRVLTWYSRPAITHLPDVRDTWTNYWGIQGMHGVVWELVNDFNSALVSGESRGDSALETSLYCGAGAAASADPSDYAAFMRYALRSSYQATSTMRSLGFRCARDLPDAGARPS